MFQTKEQDNTSEKRKKLNKMEKINLPDKKFKTMVTKMLHELGKRIEELSENFTKRIENIFF